MLEVLTYGEEERGSFEIIVSINGRLFKGDVSGNASDLRELFIGFIEMIGQAKADGFISQYFCEVDKHGLSMQDLVQLPEKTTKLRQVLNKYYREAVEMVRSEDYFRGRGDTMVATVNMAEAIMSLRKDPHIRAVLQELELIEQEDYDA